MMKRLFFAVSLVALCLLASPHSVAAKNLFNGVNCSQAAGSAACNTNTTNDPISGSNGLLFHIVNIISIVAGAAAVILILVSALRFVSSGSVTSTQSRTDTDVEDARRTLANAVIGLVVIVLARTLLLFVLSKL